MEKNRELVRLMDLDGVVVFQECTIAATYSEYGESYTIFYDNDKISFVSSKSKEKTNEPTERKYIREMDSIGVCRHCGRMIYQNADGQWIHITSNFRNCEVLSPSRVYYDAEPEDFIEN